MGQPELEAVLRRDGERKIKEIWHTAEAEAERLRRETDTKLKQLEEEQAARIRQASAKLIEEALAEAQKKIRLCRLSADQKLAERMIGLAEDQLWGLAEQGGPKLFQALAEEIPSAEWRLVKVNERDEQAAKDHFLNAEIIVTDEICGGLVVEDARAEVIIINTLTKRLEHLWPELLPDLLKQLRQLERRDETAGGP